MNPIIKLQKWMDSPAGQLFMNYAYSWGASVVILGALFKLTHITGANAMLFIGMIVEAIVFFISGFEKTYEKVPKAEGAEVAGGQTVVVAGGGTPLPEGAEIPEGPIVIGGGSPVIGGGPIIAGGAPVGNIDPDALAAGTGLSAAAANLAAAGQAAAQAQLALEQIQNGGPTIDPNQIKAELRRGTDRIDRGSWTCKGSGCSHEYRQRGNGESEPHSYWYCHRIRTAVAKYQQAS